MRIRPKSLHGTTLRCADGDDDSKATYRRADDTKKYEDDRKDTSTQTTQENAENALNNRLMQTAQRNHAGDTYEYFATKTTN